MITPSRLRAVLLVLALCPAPARAGAADPLKLPGPPAVPHAAGAPSPAPASPREVAAAQPAEAPASDARKYCQNVAAAAADARFAWQTKRLTELQGQIKQRVDDLEAKQAEYKEVLGRYDEAMKRAKTTLVDIYANMKPETAASQLSALDDATAAAVLSQLNARKASAILNEVSPERAVKLVNTISGLVPPDGKKS